MNDVIAPDGTVLPPSAPLPTAPLPSAEIAATRRYLDQARADAIRHKYERDWQAFSAWCRERGRTSLPAQPDTLAVYLGAEADRGLTPPTLTRKVSAIGYIHRRAGFEAPHRLAGGALVLETLAGIRRSRTEPVRKKAAAEADLMFAVLMRIDGDRLADLRDRAILSFGMASAMRRSELVALDVADLAADARGLRVTIRRSKTDQAGQGATIGVPAGKRLKPVEALRRWLDRAGIESGPLFRPLSTNGRRVLDARLSDRGIARVVQARFAAAGLDPALFAAHSLRADAGNSASSRVQNTSLKRILACPSITGI